MQKKVTVSDMEGDGKEKKILKEKKSYWKKKRFLR